MTPTTNVATALPDAPLVKPRSGEGGRPLPILWEQFTPRANGVLDLVDDILARCAECRVRLVWAPGVVTEVPLSGGAPVSFAFAIRNSAFRAVMARMAVLCDRPDTDTVSPYGGKGAFADPRWPHIRFLVEFANTPDAQRLEVIPQVLPESS